MTASRSAPGVYSAVGQPFTIRRSLGWVQMPLTATSVVSCRQAQPVAVTNRASVVIGGLWKLLSFPGRDVVLIGALLTGVFAAMYILTLLAWRSRARQLVDAVYPTPPTGKPDED